MQWIKIIIQLVLLTFVAFAAADVRHLVNSLSSEVRPPFFHSQRGPQIAILRSDSNTNPDGSYQYAYETENRISAEEQGFQKQLIGGSGTAVQGAYRYISPEGGTVYLQYVADENGFQPQSDVLPTGPPIPQAILKSLQWNNEHPEQETD